MNPRTKELLQLTYGAYRKAAEDACERVAKEFKPGTVIEVTIGKSRIQAVVDSLSVNWWNEPGRIRVVNTKTGKSRAVNVFSAWQNVQIISTP